MSLPPPISEPPWRIVPAQVGDAAGIARVHVLSWQAAYQGLLPAELLERLDVETRRRQWREWLTGPNAPQTLVALDASAEVLGFVSGGPLRGDYPDFDCEIAAIYLLPQFQGLGLGRTLFERMRQQLSEGGFSALLVWVLKSNLAARGFYERLGGIARLETTATLAVSTCPVEVAEVGYAWELNSKPKT